MSDLDQRHYQLMLERLQDYEQEQLPLGQLLNTLEALLTVLESTQESWKERFKSDWWTLEQVYAVNLDRNGGALSLGSEEQAEIAEAVASMRGLLSEVRDTEAA